MVQFGHPLKQAPTEVIQAIIPAFFRAWRVSKNDVLGLLSAVPFFVFNL